MVMVVAAGLMIRRLGGLAVAQCDRPEALEGCMDSVPAARSGLSHYIFLAHSRMVEDFRQLND
jgi:hypothetical protein